MEGWSAAIEPCNAYPGQIGNVSLDRETSSKNAHSKAVRTDVNVTVNRQSERHGNGIYTHLLGLCFDHQRRR